ncbi:MAG: GIDE domain-containing protein [Cyanobacteria bacterium P01_A01_bin.135]
MLPYVIFSLALLGFSAGAFRRRQTLRASLQVIQGTAIASLGELQAVVDHVAGEIGKGAYQERVALLGKIDCPTPLTAPLSQQPCVYYRTRVTERYKALQTRRDRDGNRRRQWRKGSTVLSSDELRSPFSLQDESGQVAVDPEGFTVEGVGVVERFEPVADQGAADSFAPGIAPSRKRLTPRRDRTYRTLGYHYREEILPLGATVYIIGDLTDAGGLAVRSLATPAGLITHRSQQAVVAQKQGSIRQATWVSIGLGALSATVLAYGLYQVLGN